MANPWFRMYSEFATDPKVQMLSEVDQRRLTMLFCLRCNDHVTLHDEEVTFLLRISNESWLVTKALFISKGFINNDNEVLNWDTRQFTSDTSKDRVAAFRKREKQAKSSKCDISDSDVTASNDDVTLQKQKCNAVDTDTDTDTDKTIVPSPAVSALQCPHQDIIEIYHETLPQCPRVRDWTPARQTQLRARWNESKDRQSLDYWRRFFEYVAECDFLVGKSTKPFFADLEWMTKTSNFTKIRESKYENRT